MTSTKTFFSVLLLFMVIITFRKLNCRAQPYIQMGGPMSSGDCYKDFQYLRQRFSWEQLQFFCQQWRQYQETVNANASVVTEFTDNQLTYLNSLKVNLNATVNPLPMTVRKEYRTLADNERNIFHFVLRAMKQQKIDGVSKYDLLVTLSHPALAPGAHVGAAFLPWHREYLRTFEAAMQKINTFASLPYWNPTFDEGLPDGADSILWEPDFLGNGIGPVTSGPFAGWYLHPMQKRTPENQTLARTANESLVPLTRNISGDGRLMSLNDVEYILSRTDFRQFSACLDLRLEQISRYVHEWVGGSMYDVYYSAQDPIFFMFHAYIDYLWEDWRRNRTFEQRMYGYPPNYEACTKFHYGRSPMLPFEPLSNLDGLNDVYTRLYYTYQMDPKCTAHNPSCLSPLLFCHRAQNRCLSKIRPGGNCTQLEAYDPCYKSLCVEGRCVAARPAPIVNMLNAANASAKKILPSQIQRITAHN